jgi:uncharacterized phiE125 gp8 family phage protein
MAREIITAPTHEPVTLEEAKAHLRVSGADDDIYISALISVARERAETFTQRAFVSQTQAVYLDAWPCGDLRINVAPVVAVESVEYFDTDNAEQTLDPAEYYVDTKSNPARLRPVTAWPDIYARPNAITVTFTAGYGASPAVPLTIKQAMLLMVGDMFENREESIIGTSAAVLHVTAERLLRPFCAAG